MLSDEQFIHCCILLLLIVCLVIRFILNYV